MPGVIWPSWKVYRKQLGPMLLEGAEAMDLNFPGEAKKATTGNRMRIKSGASLLAARPG